MANLTGPLTGLPCGPTDRSTTALLPLGTKAMDSSGNEYTYIKAGAAIAAKEAVTFQGSALGFDDVRKTSAVSTGVIGVATAAFASGDYGFVQSRGICECKVVNSTAAKSPLDGTATAGTLGIAVNSNLQCRPVVALVTGVSTGSTICLL